MIQSQDNFTRDLQALYKRIGLLKRRKEQKASPATEVAEQAFAELQTLMEEMRVVEETLRQQRAELVASARRIEAERKRYEDLFEFAPDGYLVTDARGVIQEANRAAANLFGLEREQLVGRLLHDLLTPEAQAEVLAHLENLCSSAASDVPQTWETRLLPPNCAPLDVSLVVSTIRDRAETVVGLRWMLRDITERKQAETLRQAAVLAERNRIAQELHDTLAQGFTGISVQLEAAEDALPTSTAQAQAHLVRARSLARESLAETRRSVWALRPHMLQGGDLPGALAHTVAEMTSGTALHTTFDTVGTPYPLPTPVEDNLLRICQEALTNALKHAQAKTVKIKLSFLPKQVQLCIMDDGNGLAQARRAHSGGFGLAGMQERAERIGGEFYLESRPGQGTWVRVTLARNAFPTEGRAKLTHKTAKRPGERGEKKRVHLSLVRRRSG